MADVALAYSRLGNQPRFDEAIAEVDRHHANLLEQGINNVGFSISQAVQHALEGDIEAALDALEQSVGQGASSNGVPSKKEPAFAAIAGEPRYAALEERMRENLNRNREVVGLPPVDANYEVTALLSP